MRILIVGFGVVGRAFARLLEERRATLYRKHGLAPVLIGAVDSKGAVLSPRGVDTEALLEAKERHGTVTAMESGRVKGVPVEEIIAGCDAQLVVEASPTSVEAPGHALERLKAAFRTGKHVVCVNKGPLAVAFPALKELSRHNRVKFRYSGTVGGGTPMLAMAAECLRGDEVVSLRGVLNGTCNFILWRMDREGEDFDAALAEAVRLGYAETDPSADIDGIDTATKLVILANGVMKRPCALSDLSIKGIRGFPRERIEAARKAGKAVKLVAEIGDTLKVEPQEVSAEDPLNVPANLNCLQLSLKKSGETALVGRGAGGPETATAILRDLVDIWHVTGGAR